MDGPAQESPGRGSSKEGMDGVSWGKEEVAAVGRKDRVQEQDDVRKGDPVSGGPERRRWTGASMSSLVPCMC